MAKWPPFLMYSPPKARVSGGTFQCFFAGFYVTLLTLRFITFRFEVVFVTLLALRFNNFHFEVRRPPFWMHSLPKPHVSGGAFQCLFAIVTLLISGQVRFVSAITSRFGLNYYFCDKFKSNRIFTKNIRNFLFWCPN